MNLQRKIIKPIARAMAQQLFKVDTYELHRVEEAMKNSDKNIIVCNHPSFLDGLILGLFLPCDPVFLVHSGLKKRPLFKYLLGMVDHLEVDSTSPMAIKTITNAVNQGRPVVIFPEGRISTTGSLMKVYNGSAFVALKTGAQLIPITLQGLLKSKISRMGHNYPKTWFPNVTMKAHPVEQLIAPEGMTGRQRRQFAGEKLRDIMQNNLFDSLSQPKTLYQGFLSAMDYYGAKHNVIHGLDDTMVNYKTIHMKSHGLGYILSKHTSKKDFVGVMLPNIEACVYTFMGLSIYNRVPAMLNFTMGTENFMACLKGATVKTIVTAKKFVEMKGLQHLIDAMTADGVHIIYLEDLASTVSWTDKLSIAWRSKVRSSVDQNPEDPAVVLFTSGSESIPKGVVLSHRALLSNINQIRSVIDIQFDDKVCNVLPMFHSFGLTAGTLLPLMTGTKVVFYVNPLHYTVIPELIYDKNCTVLFGTNTFLMKYAQKANPYDFYRMRYVVAGAEKVQDATRQIWSEKFGIRLFEGYGATECAPVLAVNTPKANKFGTVGQFLPKIEYRLDPIPGVDGGQLFVKGPNLMTGYLKHDQPGIIQKVGEWYDTGDIVTVSHDGFVTIQGRTKRFVKIAGEMVSLETVEKIAGQISTSMLATSSRSDPNKGEQIILFTTDKTLTKEALRSHISNIGQSNLLCPSEIRHIDNIPLLGSGKVDYQTLKTWI